MTERTLKLIKTKNGHSRRSRKANKNQNHAPRLIRHTSQIRNPKSETCTERSRSIRNPKPVLSQAEGSEIQNPAVAVEAARFRALTAARAARQAMVQRIMAELLELDTIPPAA